MGTHQRAQTASNIGMASSSNGFEESTTSRKHSTSFSLGKWLTFFGSTGCCSYRQVWWWRGIIVSSVGIAVVLLFNIFNISSFIYSASVAELQTCSWAPGMPVLFNLKTSLGVSYEGGHWFHMAENFMVQHSILRELGYLTDVSEVFYSFDKKSFVSQLNGVTELMVLLGTIQAPGDGGGGGNEDAFATAVAMGIEAKTKHGTNNTTLLEANKLLAGAKQQPKESSSSLIPSLSRAHFIFTTTPLAKAKISVEAGIKRTTTATAATKKASSSITTVTSTTGGGSNSGLSAPSSSHRRLGIRGGSFPSSPSTKKLSRGDFFLLPFNTVTASTTEIFKPQLSVSSASSSTSGTMKNSSSTKGSNGAASLKTPTTTTVLLGGPKLNGVEKNGQIKTKLAASTPPSSSIGGGSSHSGSSEQQVCVKFMGTIGGKWPTPQRGHWFPNPGDIDSFRSKIKALCPKDDKLIEKYVKQKTYKMVIYQRDLSRKLANQDEALDLLRQRLPSELWDIQVLMHSSGRSPCELSHILYNADVLLTPHGFQSMLLLFLPRPAVIFEIFPYRYYKRGYGPFGFEYGVIHGGVMSPPLRWHSKLLLRLISTATCMNSKQCREYARNDNVILTSYGVTALVKLLAAHKDRLGLSQNFARSHLEVGATIAAVMHTNSSLTKTSTTGADAASTAVGKTKSPIITVPKEYLYSSSSVP